QHTGDCRPHRGAGRRPGGRHRDTRGADEDVLRLPAPLRCPLPAAGGMIREPQRHKDTGKRSREGKRFISLLLFAVSLCLCGSFLFFYRPGDRDLWSSHEARAGQDAQSVLLRGPWHLPRLFDEQLDLQKPPLYYWLVALTARLRGLAVDAWAVRVPAALAAWLGVLALAGMLTTRGRPVAGLVAGLVLATSLHYTWLARVGRIDLPLTLTV